MPDLAASNEELIVPLKALLSRPGFRAFAELAPAAKESKLQRNALQQQLKATFVPQAIIALNELMGGFLPLPEGATNGADRLENSLTLAAATQAEIPQDPPSRDVSGVKPLGHSPEGSGSCCIAGGYGGKAVAGSSVAGVHGRNVLGLAGMVVRHSPHFCGASGLCPAPGRGKRALQTLRQEEADQERLLRATKAVEQAEQLSGQQQIAQLCGASGGAYARAAHGAAQQAKPPRREQRLPSAAKGAGGCKREFTAAELEPPPLQQQPSAPGGGGAMGSAPYRDQPLD